MDYKNANTQKILTTGQKIRAIRTLKGLTQEEFADMMGLSRNGLGKIERDECVPRLDTIRKMEDILKMEPYSLVGVRSKEAALRLETEMSFNQFVLTLEKKGLTQNEILMTLNAVKCVSDIFV